MFTAASVGQFRQGKLWPLFEIVMFPIPTLVGSCSRMNVAAVKSRGNLGLV
jgi:hypothetical protein